MENKKRNKKTLILLSLLVIILLAVIIIFITANNYKNSPIIGTFVFDENTKYEFKSNGKGAMYLGDEEYEYKYTYSEEKNILKLDFKKEEVHDATYTCMFENEELKLIGGEGTAGGEYTLKKESK